jgi:predicted membrane-bound mannosyltransferase
VKREPLWVTALTWSGSALVVGGIGVMFYGPVVARKLRRQPQSDRSPEPPTIQAVQEF